MVSFHFSISFLIDYMLFVLLPLLLALTYYYQVSNRYFVQVLMNCLSNIDPKTHLHI